jgi:putative endonuclease
MTSGVSWDVYLARCADGTLYCGIARDVRARIAAHDAGVGARYTRGRGPLTLLAVRRCRSQGMALRLELAIKQLSRAEKLALAAEPARLLALVRAVQRKRAAVSQRGSGFQVSRTSRSG